LGLELHYIYVPTLRVIQHSSRAFPITFHRQKFVFSPLRLTIKYMVVMVKVFR
jgi:hypothetical protein